MVLFRRFFAKTCFDSTAKTSTLERPGINYVSRKHTAFGFLGYNLSNFRGKTGFFFQVFLSTFRHRFALRGFLWRGQSNPLYDKRLGYRNLMDITSDLRRFSVTKMLEIQVYFLSATTSGVLSAILPPNVVASHRKSECDEI